MSSEDNIRYMSHEQRIAEGYMKAPEASPAKPRHPREAMRAMRVEQLDEIANHPDASASERAWARRIAARKRR